MLTDAQYSALKTVALADQTASGYITNGNDIQLAEWFNVLTASYIWRNVTPMADVYDAVVWANLTPADDADGTQLFENRLLVCLLKQNSALGLMRIDPVATGKTNIRAGLSDALLNVPSAAGGVKQSAGWAGVKSAISRLGTRAEIALATGAGTQAAPSTSSYNGMLSPDDGTKIRTAA